MGDFRPIEGELTAVLNRDRFDEPPGDVTDPADLARWRAFRESYHRAQLGEAPESFPLQVDFELNSTCQMKCAHCTHGVETVRKRELSRESFEKAIDEGQRHGLCSVKLNYINEPLLRRDLAGFVRYAKSRGVLNVYFATNGLLLSRERAAELMDAGLSKVMVSLDATTAETFSLMRRSTKLSEIERNIRGLLELRAERGAAWPLVRVNFLRTPENQHEAAAFVERWKGIADSVGFQRQVRMPGVVDDLLGEDDRGAGTFRCSFLSKLLVVDSGGQILPCCTFSGREMAVGNIEDTTLEEAWKSERRRALAGLHAEGKALTNPTCAHCVGGCS
jgi:radical SAM protein with 4Fe4S-binding SPASM domain